MRVARLARDVADRPAPIRQLFARRRGSGSARPAVMPLASQVSALRPWKRTRARSEVTATIGGTLLLKPCGSSTITKAMLPIAQETQRPLGVLLVEPGSRCGTRRRAVQPSSRSAADSIASRFSDEGKNQRGYWSRIEPSWPAFASGSRPVAEPAARPRRAARPAGPLRRSASWLATRLGQGRRGSTWAVASSRCPGRSCSACALMSKTKSGGVRSTHRLRGRGGRAARSTSRRPRRAGTAGVVVEALLRPSWLRPDRRLPGRSSSGPSTTRCRSGSSRRPGSRSARPPLSRPRRRAPRQHRRRDRTLRSSDGALRRWSLDDTGGPGQRRPVSATNDILAPCGPCS